MPLEGTGFCVVTESYREISTNLTKVRPSSRMSFWQQPTYERWFLELPQLC